MRCKLPVKQQVVTFIIYNYSLLVMFNTVSVFSSLRLSHKRHLCVRLSSRYLSDFFYSRSLGGDANISNTQCETSHFKNSFIPYAVNKLN